MHTPRFPRGRGLRRVLISLLMLTPAGCFRSVSPDLDEMVCQEDKNCPDGYVCAIRGQPGGCRLNLAGVDGGINADGAVPSDIAPKLDAVSDPATVSLDGAQQQNEAGNPALDGSTVDAFADTPTIPEVRPDVPPAPPEVPDAPLEARDVALDVSPDLPVDQVPCNGGCCTNADCPLTAPVCNAANQCTKCMSDTDCSGRSATACNTSTGGCVQCTQDSHCGGATGTCDTSINRCVGCTQRSHCPGACQTCTNNACEPVKGADDPSGCAGTCDSGGECKAKRGQRCDLVTGGCIAGTTCADNYCCDRACSEPCVACNLATHEGTCTAVSSGDPPSGHGSCGTDAQCKGSCTGRTDGQCTYPTSACGNPSCSGTQIVQGGHCASGSCTPDQAQDCSGGLVCSGSACKTSCALDSDCRSNYFCSSTTCHPDAIVVSPSFGDHVCVVSADHRIHCWGRNDQGQLGDGTVSSAWTTTPSTVSGITNATAVVSGSSFSCALLSDATVRCWGLNSMTQMGINDTTSPYLASPVTPLGLSSIIALAAGAATVCAVQQGGTIKCWGYNSGGMILGSSNFMEPAPVQVSGVTGAKAVAVGMGHTCMLTTDGTPKCWGSNFKLQAGAPATTETVTSPRTVDNTGSGFTAITAGNGHACALKSGIVTCWGDNTLGQVATSVVLSPQPPQEVRSVSGITVISAAADSTCALLTNQNVWCWGNVMSSTSDAATVLPTQVGTSGATGVAGGYHSCAILGNGSVSCWGWRTDSSPPGHYPPSSPVAAAGW